MKIYAEESKKQEAEIAQLRTELDNIKGLCDSYAELGKIFDEAELTPIAERVFGIIAEQLAELDEHRELLEKIQVDVQGCVVIDWRFCNTKSIVAIIDEIEQALNPESPPSK